jgi:hypothetical protein
MAKAKSSSAKASKKKTTAKVSEKSDLLVPSNVSTTPKKGNKGLLIGLGLSALLLLCGGCALVSGLFSSSILEQLRQNGINLTDDDGVVDDSSGKAKDVDVLVGLDAANDFAEDKAENSVLVQIGDHQGDNLLFYDYSTEKSKSNVNGLAQNWLYVYIREPEGIKVDEANSFYGKYKPETTDGFIVEYNTKDGATLFQDSLYSSTSFHSLDDISADLDKMTSQAAFENVKAYFADKISEFGYEDADIREVNTAMQKIGYTDYTSDDVEIRDIWIVEIIYKDDTLTGKERTFSARVNSISRVIDSEYVYPDK